MVPHVARIRCTIHHAMGPWNSVCIRHDMAELHKKLNLHGRPLVALFRRRPDLILAEMNGSSDDLQADLRDGEGIHTPGLDDSAGVLEQLHAHGARVIRLQRADAGPAAQVVLVRDLRHRILHPESRRRLRNSEGMHGRVWAAIAGRLV